MKLRIADIIRKKSKGECRIKVQFRLALYTLTMICSIFSLMETMHSRFGNIIDIIIYVLAAVGLLVSGYYLSYDLTSGIKGAVNSVRERYSLINRICEDYHYRTVLFTSFSFLINIFYAASNGIYGWFQHSAWLGTLSAYYVVLSVMWFGLVRYGWKVSGTQVGVKLRLRELVIYRNTGILFLMNTVVLDGTVILLVRNEGGKTYPDMLIFAVAAYTFYKIIISVIHMVKARRLKSPLLVAIRNIGYADALVSLLSLQTAMLVTFNQGTMDSKFMNGLSGACVCAIISFIGIYMIYSYSRQKKNLIQEQERL